MPGTKDLSPFQFSKRQVFKRDQQPVTPDRSPGSFPAEGQHGTRLHVTRFFPQEAFGPRRERPRAEPSPAAGRLVPQNSRTLTPVPLKDTGRERFCIRMWTFQPSRYRKMTVSQRLHRLLRGDAASPWGLRQAPHSLTALRSEALVQAEGPPSGPPGAGSSATQRL